MYQTSALSVIGIQLICYSQIILEEGAKTMDKEKIKTKLLNNRTLKDNGCWVWNRALVAEGYGFLRVGKKSFRTHRLSAMIFKNFDIRSKLLVLHHCDNPPCFNPDHLWIGTQYDNIHDMKKKKRNDNVCGERVGSHKLTRKQVIDIRREYIPRKITMQKLADKYRVSSSQIENILYNKQWKV